MRHALLLATTAAVALAAASPAAAGTATVDIAATGHTTFRVPAGVSSLELTLTGARGGRGTANQTSPKGGAGAVAWGTLAVTAGDLYDLLVGLGGGGSAGNFPGGSGGGATEIRCLTAATCTSGDRLLVAGGGGGAGAGDLGGNGGDAGTTGTAGAGGAGATLVAGGTGGPGGDGALAQGGAGTANGVATWSGGGGGGGLYGGEGGSGSGGATSWGGGGGGGTSGAPGAAVSGESFALSAGSSPWARIVYSESVAPAPTLTTPAALLADRTPRFAGTAGTDTGDDATVTLEAYSGTAATGSPVATGTAAVDAGTGTWQGRLGGELADGTYTLKVVQGDAAGNAGSATATFAVDRTGPAITVGAPADGDSYTFGAAVPAAFSCADPAGVASCTATTASGEALLTGEAGTHRFTVVAVDAAGNMSTRTVTYEVGQAPSPSPTTSGDGGSTGPAAPGGPSAPTRGDAQLAITRVTVSTAKGCAHPRTASAKRRCKRAPARVTISGTAAGSASGSIVVVATARGGRGATARTTLASGRFTARLNLPRGSATTRWSLVLAYTGDAGHWSAVASGTATVPRA